MLVVNCGLGTGEGGGSGEMKLVRVCVGVSNKLLVWWAGVDSVCVFVWFLYTFDISVCLSVFLSLSVNPSQFVMYKSQCTHTLKNPLDGTKTIPQSPFIHIFMCLSFFIFLMSDVKLS